MGRCARTDTQARKAKVHRAQPRATCRRHVASGDQQVASVASGKSDKGLFLKKAFPKRNSIEKVKCLSVCTCCLPRYNRLYTQIKYTVWTSGIFLHCKNAIHHVYTFLLLLQLLLDLGPYYSTRYRLQLQLQVRHVTSFWPLQL